jgi:hypothetical protein
LHGTLSWNFSPTVKKQEERIMLSTRFVCTLFISLLLLTTAASADSTYDRDGFWGGMDAGAGIVNQSFGEENQDDVYFFLGFKGGYFITPHFLVGLELSGWLVEASDQYCIHGYCSDASEGQGIMQIFLITQLYPFKESGFFAKAGGGYVENWNENPGETSSKQGWGFTVGGGYDFMVLEYFALSPFASFSYGDTGNWDYTAVTFGLGGTFQ